MTQICFHGEAILPEVTVPNTYVLCSGGVIESIASSAPSDVPVISSRYIAPGFVDIHVHGGGGSDYMDGAADAVRTVNRTHARHGTTTIFPTTTTGSTSELQAMFDACTLVRDQWTVRDGAVIAGIHYYGPYFAEDKVGCHSITGRRNPDPFEYEHFFNTGLIRVATCAAELPGAEAFYGAAQARGCLLTCGHSNATWPEMQKAFESGMRHVDHFWSAMSSVSSLRARCGIPMQASMEQFVLAVPDMSTEVIADGRHLSDELLNFAYRMKGASRLLLVSDCSRALDMPPGPYTFGPAHQGNWFESDGTVGLLPNGGLASSVRSLDFMVRTMRRATNASLPELIRMATLTPAERVGCDSDIGSIAPGKRADVVTLDDDLHVERVFIAGEEYRP
ncbi:MAG TPA: amidohydrolase family protein [Bryobacteraceae bacterium]|nr:amidohydrolase family protein [Bryobacteraceae bacterium]